MLFTTMADGSFGVLDGEKSVVFGLPGITKINTAISGTLIDDNIWLLGNSLWAFKVAKDIIVMAFGENECKTRQYVHTHFNEDSALLEGNHKQLPEEVE